MEEYFMQFGVQREIFCLTTYSPSKPLLKELLNPFRRKKSLAQVPEFTVGMLIESARVGRWLFDPTHH